MEGFERAKEEEQARARASWKGGSQKSAAPVYRELAKTEFEGYSALRVDGATVLALVKDGVGVAELKRGRGGRGGAGRDQLLCGLGRAGGRCGVVVLRRPQHGGCGCERRVEAGAGGVGASGDGAGDGLRWATRWIRWWTARCARR